MISLKMKSCFFDRASVKYRVDRRSRQVLAKFGAFVRRTAKQSIRKRKRSSMPYRPPSSHTGLLRRFIWFAYDRQRQSVVIGPVRLSERNRGAAPEALEYGGTARVEHRDRGNKRRFQTALRKQTTTTTRIQPRPFMNPAFEQEKKRLPSLWRDSIR